MGTVMPGKTKSFKDRIEIETSPRLGSHPKMGGGGGISGPFLHKVSGQMVVESSNGFSDGLILYEQRSFILPDGVFNRMQVHRWYGGLSE